MCADPEYRQDNYGRTPASPTTPGQSIRTAVQDPFRPGLLQRLPSAPRKVAVLRASRIGDFICATPAFRALRGALPGAEISLIGLPFVADLVARSPYLDRFTEFPGFPGMAEQFFDARRAVSFFTQMQNEGFDLAIQMNGSGVYSNPIALMLGAPVTAGMIRPGDDPGLLAAAFPFPGKGHQVHRLLSFVRFLGAAPRGYTLDFPLWPRDLMDAERLLAGWPPPFIGVHPGARDLSKRWPPERFASAGAALRQEMGGTIVVIGSDEDHPLANRIAESAGQPCLNLAGRTSLGTLGGVISRFALLITNDSGPAHIAYALGTPSVTIFNDTDPAEWGPPPGGPHEVVTAQSEDARWDDGRPDSPVGAVNVTVAEVLAAARRALGHATHRMGAWYEGTPTTAAEQ